MPHTIEAMFYTSRSSEHRQKGLRRLRERFLAEFALPPEAVPVLVLDVNDAEAPFASDLTWDLNGV